MKLTGFAVVFASAAILFAAHASAQNASVAPSFTASQATAGQSTYYAQCAMCHGVNLEGGYAPALNGPNSNVQWETVGAMYAYVTVQMPTGNAGGLSSKDYTNIMAFMLKTHGHKPGATALTPSAAAGSSALMGPQ